VAAECCLLSTVGGSEIFSLHQWTASRVVFRFYSITVLQGLRNPFTEATNSNYRVGIKKRFYRPVSFMKQLRDNTIRPELTWTDRWKESRNSIPLPATGPLVPVNNS
jgi:hypothetical protein